MFKLRLQFFIVILLLTSLLTVGLYLFLKINFKRDFWHYIEKKETRFAQPIINDLVENYRKENNWQWITDWDAYLSQHFIRRKLQESAFRRPPMRSMDDDDLDDDDDDFTNLPPEHATEHPLEHAANSAPSTPASAPQNVTAGSNPMNPPPSDWREFRHRPPHEAMRHFYLLDKNKKLIAGNVTSTHNNFLLPLKMDDQIVGFLGIPFNPDFRDLPDINFATGQEQKFAIIVIIALLLASMAAFPLAHFMTQRIKNLQQQVEYLNQGHYEKKISIKGSDELSLLAEHLNNLAETLAQTETARRQWVADISHELRTPIAVLQAELEAIEDRVRPLDEKSIKRLSDHCLRLKRLVNDLYELSLTDLGGMAYRKTMLNFTELVQSTTTSFQTQFEKEAIKLQVKITQEPLFIFGDQDRLEQLLANLFKNSLQYTNSPGKAIIRLSAKAELAELIVEDSAPGVASENHARLFDRLYRAESSRNRSTGGAGLGLSICKNIIAAHEGQVTISNSELGGLKISILFPVKRELA